MSSFIHLDNGRVKNHMPNFLHAALQCNHSNPFPIKPVTEDSPWTVINTTKKNELIDQLVVKWAIVWQGTIDEWGYIYKQTHHTMHCYLSMNVHLIDITECYLVNSEYLP